MDLFYFVPSWPAPMACSDYAAVPCPCSRRWYWLIHCVSSYLSSQTVVPTDWPHRFSGTQVHWTKFVPRLSHLIDILSFHTASGGLNVIGGDPINFVGLGGCLESGTPHSLLAPPSLTICVCRLAEYRVAIFLWNQSAKKSYHMARYLHGRVCTAHCLIYLYTYGTA